MQGLAGSGFKAGLEAIGVDIAKLTALLVTHEHSDHVSGVGVLSRKYKIPIYSKRTDTAFIIENEVPWCD